jgi:hypothetical protein
MTTSGVRRSAAGSLGRSPGRRDRPSNSLDEWIDGREQWLADGKTAGYVVSDVCCGMHDGAPLTTAEELAIDDGYDPCVPIVRLADEPGEPYIKRFGPSPGAEEPPNCGTEE